MDLFNIALVIVGVCFGVIAVIKSLVRNKASFELVGLAGLFMAFVAASAITPVEIQRLIKDVPLEKVPISGEKSFTAQIEITYNNGTLVSIKMTPGTIVEKIEK